MNRILVAVISVFILHSVALSQSQDLPKFELRHWSSYNASADHSHFQFISSVGFRF